MLAKDARIARTSTAPRRTESQLAARRGRIGDMSDKSRRRLLELLRNCPRLRHFITLTFPGDPPRDDRTAKKRLHAFQKWAGRQGASLVWRQEFTRDGRPHFHLLATVPLDESAVRRAWARILGCGETAHLVESRPVRNKTAVEWYLAKPKGEVSNLVPPGYANMGRWWGRSGPDAVAVPLLRIEGDERDVAKVCRVAKKIHRATFRYRATHALRDGGTYGFSLYDGGGESIARALLRFAETIPGLTIYTSLPPRGVAKFESGTHTCPSCDLTPATIRLWRGHLVGEQGAEQPLKHGVFS